MGGVTVAAWFVISFVATYVPCMKLQSLLDVIYYYDHYKTTNTTITRLVKIMIPRDEYSIR